MRLPALIPLLTAVASSLTLIAGTAAAESPRTMAYVSVSGANEIAAYQLDGATGKLSEHSRLKVAGAPGAQAVSPDRRRLYAALRSIKSVGAFQIDPQTGTLTELGVSPTVSDAAYLATDRTGRWLLTAYYIAGKVAVYPIEAGGRVSPQAAVVLEAEKNPHAIVLDRSGSAVLVPNCGSDSLLQYRLDTATGRLTPAGTPRVGTAAGAGPRHLVQHPALDVVYVVNEKNSTVSVYALDARAGTLTLAESHPTLPADFSGKNTCADIHLTPSGRWLYASNRGHDSLAAFAVDPATGRLRAVGQTTTEKTPRSFAIDPTGNYLVAAGQGSGRLQTYRIDAATGQLTPLATYDVGPGPAWVELVTLR